MSYPKGIYKCSEEKKKMLRKRMIGNTLGIGHSVSMKLRDKLRKNMLGSNNPMFEVVHSQEYKDNMRRAMTVEIRKLISKKLKGDKAYNWIDGRTPENNRIRRSLEGRQWEREVFERDNRQCLITGRKGRLSAHHIKCFGEYPELRFVLSNGFTMLRLLHREFHRLYGFGKNTLEQLGEFMQIVRLREA